VRVNPSRMIRKLGVFDSGVGGVTVLQALRKKFPSLELVYLGDTANVPYGTKSPSQIEQLSLACARRLREEQVDALVVACNTASSWALSVIREEMGPTIDVFGMVEPGVAAVLERSGDPSASILILATRATVRSQAYRRAFEASFHERDGSALAPRVFEQACPLLVPMIEEGWLDHPILHQTIEEYVKKYHAEPPGVALLGCTHYPWVKDQIAQHLPGWTVVDSAESVASYLGKWISASHALLPTDAPPGSVKWIFTDPEAVPEFARRYQTNL
jgi:glutamate racemase